MDKITEEQVTITVKTHKIYCDRCNKLCDEIPDKSGNYYNPYNVKNKFNISYLSGDVILRNIKYKDLCDDCRDEFIEELDNALKNLGYEEVIK